MAGRHEQCPYAFASAHAHTATSSIRRSRPDAAPPAPGDRRATRVAHAGRTSEAASKLAAHFERSGDTAPACFHGETAIHALTLRLPGRGPRAPRRRSPQPELPDGPDRRGAALLPQRPGATLFAQRPRPRTRRARSRAHELAERPRRRCAEAARDGRACCSDTRCASEPRGRTLIRRGHHRRGRSAKERGGRGQHADDARGGPSTTGPASAHRLAQHVRDFQRQRHDAAFNHARHARAVACCRGRTRLGQPAEARARVFARCGGARHGAPRPALACPVDQHGRAGLRCCATSRRRARSHRPRSARDRVRPRGLPHRGTLVLGWCDAGRAGRGLATLGEAYHALRRGDGSAPPRAGARSSPKRTSRTATRRASRRAVQDTFALADATGGASGDPGLHRLHGESLLAGAPGRAAGRSRPSFERALELAEQRRAALRPPCRDEPAAAARRCRASASPAFSRASRRTRTPRTCRRRGALLAP